MPSSNLIIDFANKNDSAQVSAYSKAVLEDIMKKANLSKIIITSTARTSHDQARIMHDNIQKHGVNHQKKLYGKWGDRVIDTYTAAKGQNKNRTETISLMKAKIDTLGPSKVSRHAADTSKVNVVDIAPSSIPTAKTADFIKAVKAESKISRFFKPPKDPAFHLEIPQPASP